MIEINNKKLCESCFEEVEGEGICPHCGFTKEEFSPDAMVLPLGTRLNDKIIIGRVMGKGGFGVTYLGYDLRMEKTIAVKEYYPNGIAYRSQSGTEVLVADPKSGETFDKGTEKFYTEAEMVAQFNGNPNIVGVYDYFRANNTVYLIMEYLNGITLKNYVKKHGKITDGQALYVMDKMAAALSITHSAGVLHRDISPDNIMVCLDGKVKLIDFGAARQIVAESSSNLTVVMKPGYTPIEQYTKKGKQGAWTDIYALGASIYYAMTGKIIDDPYERMENDVEFASNRHGINDSLWSVIKKCTMINSTDRYGNAIELRKALSTVSAPIKAEPIVLNPDDVKLVSREEEKEKEDVKGFLAASMLDSQEPIELFASKEPESGVEEYESPAVSEEEGYKAGEDVYSKTEDKKKPDKKLLFGIIGGAAGVLIAAIIIVLVVALPKALPTGSNVSDPVYINYDNNQLWSESNAISKETLQSFGGDVRITLDIMTTNNTDTIFEHTVFRHTVNPQSLAGYLKISADNGYSNGTHNYDIYEGQTAFVFTVAKEDIDAMEGDLVFMPNKVELHSATVEAYNGKTSNTKTVTFTEDYPGDWQRFETYISKEELLSFGGDVRFDVEYDILTSSAECYIKTIDEDWNPVIVDVPNMMPDDGETSYELLVKPFVFNISHDLIEQLSDRGLGFQMSGLLIKSVTMRSASYGVSSGSIGIAGTDGSAAANDEIPETRVEPTVFDYPDGYVGDWNIAAALSKHDLAAYGTDVKVTLEIESGKCETDLVPCLKIIYGEQINADDLITGNDLRAWQNTDDVLYDCPEGKTLFNFYISKENIDKLTDSGLAVQTANVTISKATITPVLTFELNSADPGDWVYGKSIYKGDFTPYYPGDVKVTLELERTNNSAQRDDWVDADVYYYHLFIHDGTRRSVITNMFNAALSRGDTNDGNFFLGGIIDEYAVDGRTDIYEFVMTKEEVERIDTLLQFKCGNAFVRSATFEAYDPAEDAVSADARGLELGLSWRNEDSTGTTDITKSDLESIGGDVLITLDITGELQNANGDGIAHIYSLDSRDGTQVPLYARNQGAAEDHAYHSEYNVAFSYPLGYWEFLPDQVQFVITEEQIKNLGEWGIHFSISNGYATKAYLEPARY